jgi:hypothetical protein
LVRRLIKYGTVGIIIVFAAIQAIPYGRSHNNPPVIIEPEWDLASTRELALRACFDCHSNETYWPWYSKIAPVSWWTLSHVEEGRDELNFSEWSWSNNEVDEISKSVMDGEMPPSYYNLAPGSRALSKSERDQLIRGFVATFDLSPNRQPHDGAGEDEDEEDENGK